MSNVQVTFNEQVCHSGRYNHRSGITYSEGRVEGPNVKELAESLQGQLVLGDGKDGFMAVDHCAVLSQDETEDYSTGGSLGLTFADPRLEWSWGAIVGRYNILRDDAITYADGTTKVDQTPWTWQELVRKCLEKMKVRGERFGDTAAFNNVTWVPTDIVWTHEPPALVLQRDLLEPIGYIIVRQTDGLVEIHQLGVGKDAPDGFIEKKPLHKINNVAMRPTHIRVVGGRKRIQETSTSWLRVLPHDGKNSVGATVAGIKDGELAPFDVVATQWGYSAAEWAKGILKRVQFSNYTGDGTTLTAGSAIVKDRRRRMRKYQNRFIMLDSGTDRAKLPMLNHTLDMTPGGFGGNVKVKCEAWKRNDGKSKGFTNLASTDAAEFPAKIIDANLGLIEILSELPVGTLSKTTGFATVEDLSVTLTAPSVEVTHAYFLNTGASTDYYTLERQDPQDGAAQVLFERPNRYMTIRRPEFTEDTIDGVVQSRTEVDTKASALINKIWDTPLSQEAWEVTYNGLVRIDLDGIRRRVDYLVPENGMPQTVLYINTERPDTDVSPTSGEIVAAMLRQAASGKSQQTLAAIIHEQLHQSHLKDRSIRPENGEGGTPTRDPNREAVGGFKWLHILTDDTSANAAMQMATLKTVSPGDDGGYDAFTNEGPIWQAHFITSQTSDMGPDGKWIMPGYAYAKITAITGTASAASMTVKVVDVGGTTSSGNTLTAVPSPRMFKIHKALYGAYNDLAGKINALIDVHSTGAALPGALGLLTAGHLKMDTTDETIVFFDYAGETVALHDTDMMWP